MHFPYFSRIPYYLTFCIIIFLYSILLRNSTISIMNKLRTRVGEERAFYVPT
jgi:hypothetical protein